MQRGRQIYFLAAMGAAALLMGVQTQASAPESLRLGTAAIGGAAQSSTAATASPQPGRTVVDEAGLRVAIPAGLSAL